MRPTRSVLAPTILAGLVAAGCSANPPPPQAQARAGAAAQSAGVSDARRAAGGDHHVLAEGGTFLVRSESNLAAADAQGGQVQPTGPAGGTWTPATRLTPPGVRARWSQIALGECGHAAIAWSTRDHRVQVRRAIPMG